MSALLLACVCGFVSACGTPGAPLPPSLNLPDRVGDLSAARVGNHVSLNWTMPRRNTDKLRLKGDIDVRVCRHLGSSADAGPCVKAGSLQLPGAAAGSFSETLPAALVTGAPRPLTYFVELTNRHGRSAGLSNPATVLAGEAPPPVAGLAAEVHKQGIVLRWDPADPGASIRLRRTLLTPQPSRTRNAALSAPAQEAELNLLVEAGQGAELTRAIDKEIVFGNSYEYRAQRIVRQPVNGDTVELQGELSPPVRVAALDVFPPAAPAGLVAVATAADPASGSRASIDLSWQPNTDPDLAGYAVYRREDAAAWQRVSGDQPVVGPAFHDPNVVAGHTYRYSVTALDKGGHESTRSPEASDTVPPD